MKNFEDAVGAFLTNNHRYIKLDGSGFYSGKLKSIFERANFNAGALAVIALSAIDYFSQTDLTTITPQTYNNLIQNGGIFAGLMVFAQRGVLYDAIWPERKHRKKANKFFTKAIDTTGRSLSRMELSTLDMMALVGGRSVGTLGPMLFLPFSHLVLSNVYGLEGAVIHTTMVSGAGIAMSNRFNKLIRGHMGMDDGYVFMDEPPAKESKETKRQVSFGGLTNPAP